MMEITWEELIVIRKWFCLDDMFRLRDLYPSDSLGYKELDMIIRKWTEFAHIKTLVEKENRD